MADRISRDRRSANMARIRSKNTKPEMTVRRLLHGLGYRYRIHARDLPGEPDIALRSRKKVIFVHGCFWHRHAGCQDCSNPGTRKEYWIPKFEATVARDAAALADLQAMGWGALVIWACEAEDSASLQTKVVEFLGEPKFA